MDSKILIALCLVAAVATVSAQPGVPAWGAIGAGAANPWIPPWVLANPWIPKWSPCTTLGPSCVDCNTKIICTIKGSFQRACTDPTLPYCNLGKCSATPTAECAPATAPEGPVPAVPVSAV